MALGRLDGNDRTDIWISRCESAGPEASVLLLLAKGETGLKHEAPDLRPGGYCAYGPEIADGRSQLQPTLRL